MKGFYKPVSIHGNRVLKVGGVREAKEMDFRHGGMSHRAERYQGTDDQTMSLRSWGNRKLNKAMLEDMLDDGIQSLYDMSLPTSAEYVPDRDYWMEERLMEELNPWEADCYYEDWGWDYIPEF